MKSQTVFLQFHSFHCRSFHIPATEGVSRGLKINYCSEGRMEVRMSDNLCLFMEPGTLSMDIRTAQDRFQFPCGHYHGIELFLHDDMINNGTPDAWDSFGIDLKQVKHRFCGDGKSYVVFADDRFRSLFQSMSDAPQGCQLEYLQIKAAEPLWNLGGYTQNDFKDTLERGMSADFCNTLEAMSLLQVEHPRNYCKNLIDFTCSENIVSTIIHTLPFYFHYSPLSIKIFFASLHHSK